MMVDWLKSPCKKVAWPGPNCQAAFYLGAEEALKALITASPPSAQLPKGYSQFEQ